MCRHAVVDYLEHLDPKRWECSDCGQQFSPYSTLEECEEVMREYREQAWDEGWNESQRLGVLCKIFTDGVPAGQFKGNPYRKEK